jgi:hypothetical protein
MRVGGIPYANTAAKFWSSLFDEVSDDFAEGAAVELEALTGGLLVPDLLSPEALLQRDLETFNSENVQQAFTDALNALAVLGPPSGVRLRLRAADGRALGDPLDLDYLDAELLPYLVAWMLEWAGLPDALWNEPEVKGGFRGEDLERGLIYEVTFELRSRHLSEGLFDRVIKTRFLRGVRPAAP